MTHRTWLTSLVVLACAQAPLMLGTAHADIAPPRIVPTTPPGSIPGPVKSALTALTKAIEASDEAAFKRHCDDRGYEVNLVGGSGGTVKGIFEQGSRKRWGLVRHGAATHVSDEAFIVPVDVKAFAGGKVLDQLFVLFIETDDGWRVLGAGENLADVRALCQRFDDGAPLAPPEKAP